VAICRLKRVAADYKGEDMRARMPPPRAASQRQAHGLRRRRPASLTVARDLAVARLRGHGVRRRAKAGGFIRTQIPRFRLPEGDRRGNGYILDLGVDFRAASASSR
jgi:formate dehydrogenase beta subunit